MWELWVKFYLGQNEDYSLGDSLSYRSEELCQRNVCVCVCVCVCVSPVHIFSVWRGYMQSWKECLEIVKTSLDLLPWQRLPASHEEQMPPFCRYEKVQDTRLIKSSFESVSSSFPRALRASFLISALNALQVVLKITDSSDWWLHLYCAQWWGKNSYLFHLLDVRSLSGPWGLPQGHVLVWKTIGPSLALQMRNQDQQILRDMTKVSVDQRRVRNTLQTKWGPSQKGRVAPGCEVVSLYAHACAKSLQ